MTTKNTDLVANFEATPQVANSAAELAGVLRTAHGSVELAAGDSTDNDIVMLSPIPSNAALPTLFVGSDTFGVSCTFNVGVYKTDGTVKDEDVFASAVADLELCQMFVMKLQILILVLRSYGNLLETARIQVDITMLLLLLVLLAELLVH